MTRVDARAEEADVTTTISVRDREPGFFARTLEGLRELWDGVAGSESVEALHPDLPARSLGTVERQMAACLEGKGGEVSARKRAAALGQAYLSLSRDGKRRFLVLLAERFGTDQDAVGAAIEAWNAADVDDRDASERAMRAALSAPRTALLRQFNGLPQGVKFLVDMRADILSFLKEEPALKPLDADLRDLLSSWFDIGFLEMRSISWNSPAALLEKLIEYEAVHAIRSWDDLRNRLESDRRLFAFFHPRMPDEPLIFVEVALVNGISASIQALLDENAPTEDPHKADTAIFYSISNAQKGLRGISLGNFLIKRVVDELSRDLPNLRTFSTLSPIPGFARWLAKSAAEGEKLGLTAQDRRLLKEATGTAVNRGQFLKLLDDPTWHEDEALALALRDPLSRLCARYLLKAKRRDQPLDPVARFHLNNGAQLERINWLGDVSPKGIEESAGMMVNYLYRLSDIERNHERFASDGTIAASSQVRSLL
jgi:malonyl-CoA decarboxylase